MVGEQPDFGIVQVHRMNCDELGADQAQLGQAFKGPHAVPGNVVGDFAGGFMHMHMNRQLQLGGELDDFAKGVVGHRIGGVR